METETLVWKWWLGLGVTEVVDEEKRQDLLGCERKKSQGWLQDFGLNYRKKWWCPCWDMGLAGLIRGLRCFIWDLSGQSCLLDVQGKLDKWVWSSGERSCLKLLESGCLKALGWHLKSWDCMSFNRVKRKVKGPRTEPLKPSIKVRKMLWESTGEWEGGGGSKGRNQEAGVQKGGSEQPVRKLLILQSGLRKGHWVQQYREYWWPWE